MYLDKTFGRYTGLLKLHALIGDLPQGGLLVVAITNFLVNYVLNNASYHAAFTFGVGGKQHVDITRGAHPTPVPYYNVEGSTLDGDMLSRMFSYVSVMEGFGRLMTESVVKDDSGGTSSATSTLVESARLGRLLDNTSTSNATVARFVEELFENVTMSLLSSDGYITNASTVAADPAL